MLNVLVAEKDFDFRQQVKHILTGAYHVFEADNGIEAIEISDREQISIYLLNCDMPFISEKDFMRRFENLTIRPILLYGRADECSLPAEYPFIHFFEATKDEAVIRREVDLLRYHHFGLSEDARFFRFKGIEIDYVLKKLFIDDREVRLTPKEFDLLVFLLNHSGSSYSREALLEKVWGYEFLGDSRTIDTHIKSLRNKLGPYRGFIITIWGKGYKMELPEDPNGSAL